VLVINDESLIVMRLQAMVIPAHADPWPRFRYYPNPPVVRPMETLKNLGNDSRSLRLDLKLGSSKSNFRLLAMSCAIYGPEGSDSNN